MNVKEKLKNEAKGTIKNPLVGEAKGTNGTIKNPLSGDAKMSGAPEAKSTKIVKKILGK